MATPNADALALLLRIAVAVERLVAQSRTAAGPRLAADSDLDSQWGDEVVKFDPRDWTGEKCKGRKMSECPAPFLDMLADVFAYYGDKNEADGATTDSGAPKAKFDRRSESRARGWARRVRDGKVPVAAAAGPDSEWPDAGF
jgi:hypothetical protein